MHDVVCITPGLRTIATGEAAMPIPDDHRSPQRHRHDRGASSDIERLRARSHHETQHGGVARHLPGGTDVYRPRVVELGWSEPGPIPSAPASTVTVR
jgi:hypothetical protein